MTANRLKQSLSFNAPKMDRESAWLLTYISLFTSLLAFFILSMNLVTLEQNSEKRHFQKIQMQLFKQTLAVKKRLHLDWLQVENTVSKGIRLTLQTQDNGDELFTLGSNKLAPAWQNRLIELSVLLDQLQLESYTQRQNQYIETMTRGRQHLQLQLLIEGHTDARPIKSARFPSNWELSTARAMTIQAFLEQKLKLPAKTFAIAGLGSFRPKNDVLNYAENRRIEIYMQLNIYQKQTSHDTP
ncbi:MAG: OmpA family protein [Gammaproteobacteria bacterium]|nr:OmpA family protein [Gammaproteobacteria bacterium]